MSVLVPTTAHLSFKHDGPHLASGAFPLVQIKASSYFGLGFLSYPSAHHQQTDPTPGFSEKPQDPVAHSGPHCPVGLSASLRQLLDPSIPSFVASL